MTRVSFDPAQTAHGRRSRRAFTLLEMMLAMTIGALALILAAGVFFTVGNVDRSSERAHRVRTESYITQTVLRNTFMSLMVVHGNAQDDESPPDPSTMGRARMILEPDAATLSQTQRFEVVLRSTPVPGVLQGPAARLAFLDEDAASLNFASADGAGGSARCVFELRRDGERERVMRELGIDNPMSDAKVQPAAEGESQGWSLWWRRMTIDETETLDAGYLPWADGEGNPDDEARRLASSVRLASGLSECIWKIFHRGERKTEFVGWSNGDLPAYVEIQFADDGAEYASWMFEIGWAYGEPEDVVLADDAAGGAGAGGAGAGGTGTGGTAGGRTAGGRTGGGNRNTGDKTNVLRRIDESDRP